MRQVVGASLQRAWFVVGVIAAILFSGKSLADGELCAPPALVALPRDTDYAVGRKDYQLPGPVVLNRDSVRVAATVRYPMAADGQVLGTGKLPLVVFLHGNHGIVRDEDGRDLCSFDSFLPETPNHAGYDFALEALARRGYVAISINGNDLNCLEGRIVERGQLILQHLALWKKLASGRNPMWGGLFQDRVDLSRVGLVGHSRGGEAIVSAAMDNRDPEIKIGGLFSIAPVDMEALTWDGDAPLFMLLPAGDGDVDDIAGARIYDRMALRKPHSFKAQQYLYGANHNWFNTEWRDDDADDTDRTIGQRLSAENQKDFMREFLIAFFGYTLKNETFYRPVLEGDVKLASLASFPSYPSFESGAALTIDDFERAPDRLLVNSLKGENKQQGFLKTLGMWIGGTKAGAQFIHQTRAMLGTWFGQDASFTATIPQHHRHRAKGQRVISFRAAAVHTVSAPAAKDAASLNMEVSVVDGAGRVASIDLASLGAEIPRPYAVNNAMHTVRIPLACFKDQGQGADLDDIEQLRIGLFGGVNREIIALDQIQISP